MLNKSSVEIALSEMSKTVLYTQFSQWRKDKVVVGVRITAGKEQFTFYVGPENKVVETVESAHGWELYERAKATQKNTELENDLREMTNQGNRIDRRTE